MKEKTLKFLKYFYYTFIFTIIIKIIFSNIRDFKNITFKINYKYYILAILIYLFHKYLNSLIWYYITKNTKCNLDLKNTIRFWIYSQKSKFAPGKLFYLFDRINYYKKNNKCIKKATYSFLLEDIYNYLAPLFIFFLILPLANVKFYQINIFHIFILITILIFFLNPKFIEKAINIMLKLLKKNTTSVQISAKNSFLIFLYTFINFIILSIGFYFVILSISSINILYCIAVFSLVNGISIINAVFPLSFGLKETIILLSLKPYISVQTILIILILMRIWTSLGKILLIAFQIIQDKIDKFCSYSIKKNL